MNATLSILIHAHTSNPNPAPELNKYRIFPKASDEFKQAEFIGPLQEIGVEYCSVEAEALDFSKDIAAAYEVLEKLR